MQTGYFWPIYAEQGEVVFPCSTSRSGESLPAILGAGEGVLLIDGYAAYEKYASSTQDLVHAQCWSHSRRQFVPAQDVEPELAGKALDAIGRLYAEEERLGKRWTEPGKRLEERPERCKPIVDELFESLKTTLWERVLLPRNPFTEAAGYALDREGPLRVFLEDPDVPLDTNHLERQIRPSPSAGRTGCSAGAKWGPSTSAASKAFSRPVACRAWIPTPTWWTCCSGWTVTRRSTWPS